MLITLVFMASSLANMTLAAGIAPALPTAVEVVAVVPRAAGIVDLGRAPAGTPIALAVALHYRSEQALAQLVALQSDARSPLFRHYLSNDAFNRAFAPAATDYARVVGALRGAGFRVTRTYANRTVVDASGTVASANRLFSADVHRVVQRGRGVRLANALPARTPASLQGLIAGVDGLQTLTLLAPAHALARVRARAASEVPAVAGPPLYGPVSGQTGYAGYGPLAFSGGYDAPQQHTRGGKPYDGWGRTSGIVIDGDYVDSDLTSYLKYFRVVRTGPPTVRIPIDGGPPPGDGSSDSLEATLDVEATVANAPGTKLYVYEFPSFDSDRYITDAYNQIVSDNLVDTANSSFSGCETGDASGAKTWDHLAQQGAAKGITFEASTGDYGADSCGTGRNTVSEPASGPNFAAIGGTSLSVGSTGSYLSESVWNSGDGYAAGGGVSQIFPLPAWQAAMAGIVKGGRNLPDVSFDADPYPGMALYYQGTWDSPYDPIGGTSLSAPLFGAALSEANQFLGGRSGLAAVAMYRYLKNNAYRSARFGVVFHDVTRGCNGFDSAGFCAGPAYDTASGLGSVVWWHYIE